MSARRDRKKALESKKAATPSLNWIWLAVILVVTTIAYQGHFDNEYLNYDDDIYVTSNPLIISQQWDVLFSGTYLNQYSPVAMFIMGMEFKMFGQDLGWIRGISLLIHLLNAFLILKIFRHWDKDGTWAYLLALLFALQPMNVESVAWLAAAMKIGTFTLFFLASVHFYIKYRMSDATKDLIISWIFFVISCLCKEQAVVLPLLLMAIDHADSRDMFSSKRLLQKVPFLLLSVIIGLVTLTASDSFEAEKVIYAFSIGERILFSFYAMGVYTLKTFIPFDLSMFYTYPIQGQIPAYYYLFALIPIGMLALLVRWYKKDEPLLFLGMAFFFVNVSLPAFISILSVRDVVMADRYTYLPSVGLFLILLVDLEKQSNKNLRYVPYALALFFFISTFTRVDVFQNSATLFSDVIEKESYSDKANPYLSMPYNNRGVHLKKEKKLKEAAADFKKAIAMNPKYASGYLNLANIDFDAGKDDSALEGYNKTLELEPKNAKALSSRGSVYGKKGQNDIALADLTKALEIDPYFINAYSNRALLYLQVNQPDKSILDLNEILKLDPNKHDIYEFRGHCRTQIGEYQAAIQDYNKAISMAPDAGSYYLNRSYVFAKMGDKQSATRDAKRAAAMGQKLDPAYLESLK
jgi:protein O-mannosyl-transferase